MKTLKIGEDSSKLAKEVLKDLRASPSIELFKCLQCGMCVSLCPAARYSDYNPREMVKRVLDGDEDILSDDDIWNCFYCYTCHSVCPANNSACEVNQILRQKAINEKDGLDKISSFLTYGDSFVEIGIGSIPSAFFDQLVEDFGEDWLNLKINLENVRKKLGLKPVLLPEESIEEINLILKNTKFINRLERIRRLE
ncbi:MAG: ferredoxin:CoB-CoM heterodisulfide reductase subunit HdrC [Methanobacteriaceae archaeon]|nr:ferredoxin:CoB-CoM heterodisulfide reductase subunit HdrC [Methanobacteriaceae archaeon]